MDGFDDNGWAVTAVAPWALGSSYCLLSPTRDSQLNEARFQHQARRFFAADLSLEPPKTYPGGGWPARDLCTLAVRRLGADGEPTRVAVLTCPLDDAPEVRAAAAEAVEAIGGAGFDVLLGRALRLWQVCARVGDEGDARAPTVVAAVLASTLLAPVLPPEGGTIFGVKGTRLRLQQAGWRC